MTLDPQDPGITLTVLLAVSPGAATSLAMFNASAAVNRIRAVPGFSAAAFMVSPEDDLLLESVRWDSLEAMAGAKADHRYSDHVAINQEMATLRYLGISPFLRGPAPLIFERGDIVSASLTEMFGGTPAETAAAIPNNGSDVPRLVRHIAARQNGVGIATFSKTGHHTLPPALGGIERWRNAFKVVEAVTADPAARQLPVLYRLLSPRRSMRTQQMKQSDG
jgi:hypothetical protein